MCPDYDKLTPWWQKLEDNAGSLRNLVKDYYPRGQKHAAQIAAPAAEAIAEVVRPTYEDIDGLFLFDAARTLRDTPAMHSVLSGTWWGLPESESVRSLPGFGALCDLCSEYEPEE
jgi:hypothetical protein